jgi:hypothetical protein
VLTTAAGSNCLTRPSEAPNPQARGVPSRVRGRTRRTRLSRGPTVKDDASDRAFQNAVATVKPAGVELLSGGLPSEGEVTGTAVDVHRLSRRSLMLGMSAWTVFA